MASGTITLTNSGQTSGGGYLMGKVEWSSTPTTSTNSSSVIAKLYVKKASAAGAITVATTGHWDCSLTINGSNTSNSVEASVGADWVLMMTKTAAVAHNSDGTKSIAIAASAYGPSETSYSGLVTQGSGTATLDSIPRASTCSFGTFTMGSAGAIAITRASSSFTHTLTYKFGSASGTIASKSTATSISWTPSTDLAAQLPNATSGTGTITLTTYSGTTAVGSKIYACTLSVPASVVPSISAVSITEAVSGLSAKFGAYIQNKSKLAVAITAAGVYGSTVKSYSTTIQGRSYTAASFTSGLLTASGTSTITVKVTDSRGRSSSKSYSLSVLAYTPPKITTLRTWRIDATGEADDSGEYMAIQLAYTVTSLNEKNDRALTIQYQQGASGALETISSGTAEVSYSGTTNYTSGPVLSPDYTYTVQVTLADYFSSISYTAEIPTSMSIMDILASGDGISFGKAAETDNLLDVDWNMIIRGDLFLEGRMTSESIGTFTGNINGISSSNSEYLPSRSTICWCNAANLSGTLPVSSGYFILETLAVGSSTFLQRATTYSSTGNYGVYIRMYVNSRWYPWASQ